MSLDHWIQAIELRHLPYMLATLVIFTGFRRLLSGIRFSLANPLLLSILVLISVLFGLGLDYQDYAVANQPLRWLLEPAVVILALPLFNQLHTIRQQLKPLLLSCLAGVMISLSSTLAIALALGADRALILSLLPKSVTSPIAMAIAEQTGGQPTLAAAVVIVVGLLGALGGFSLLTIGGIRDPHAQGLAIGSSAHAIGTARAMEEGAQQGSFSSLALVLCGIITALLAPFAVLVLDWIGLQ